MVFQYILIKYFGVIADDSKRLALSLNDKMILGGYLARLFPLLFALIIINLKKSLSSYLLIGTLFILTDTIIYITGGGRTWFDVYINNVHYFVY